MCRRAIWTEREYFKLYQWGKAKDDEFPESRKTCRVAADVLYAGTKYIDGELVLANEDFLNSVLQKSPTIAIVSVWLLHSRFKLACAVVKPRCMHDSQLVCFNACVGALLRPGPSSTYDKLVLSTTAATGV